MQQNRYTPHASDHINSFRLEHNSINFFFFFFLPLPRFVSSHGPQPITFPPLPGLSRTRELLIIMCSSAQGFRGGGRGVRKACERGSGWIASIQLHTWPLKSRGQSCGQLIKVKLVFISIWCCLFKFYSVFVAAKSAQPHFRHRN